MRPFLASIQIDDDTWDLYGSSDSYTASVNGPPGHSKRGGSNGFSGPPGHNKWGGGRGPPGGHGPPGLAGGGPPGLINKYPPGWNGVDNEGPSVTKRPPDAGNEGSTDKQRPDKDKEGPSGPDGRKPDSDKHQQNRRCRYVRLSYDCLMSEYLKLDCFKTRLFIRMTYDEKIFILVVLHLDKRV